jgi:hypothetical protein
LVVVNPPSIYSGTETHCLANTQSTDLHNTSLITFFVFLFVYIMDTSPKLCNVFLSSNAALLFFQPAPVFPSIILGNLFVLPNLQGNHPPLPEGPP